MIVLYRKGNTHTIRGHECEAKRFPANRLKQALASGWVADPAKTNQEELERIAKEKAEAERIATEKAEKERLEAEQAEKERLAAEKARIEAEKAAKPKRASRKQTKRLSSKDSE